MNAYELADKLQMDKAKALLYVDTVVQSAEMLRQQADRIAELEKQLQESAIHNISVTSQADRIAELEKQLQKQISEPVETKTIYKITPEMIGASLGLKSRRKKKNDYNNS